MPRIVLRNSVVQGNQPVPGNISIGELCVNAHPDTAALYFKDNAGALVEIKRGNVIAAAAAPTAPGTGDLWFDTANSVMNYWDGAAWQILGSGAVTVASVAPAGADVVQGSLWWDSVGGQLYVWYDDGNSQQWVQANPQAPAPVELWDRTGTTLSPTNAGDDVTTTGDIQSTSQNGGQLAGFRNWIVNGAFNVNQRGGTRTPGVGVYGFDRWKGHASGLEQIVEALPAGEYTLSWSGGGNGTFGGTTAASPITATVVAGDTSVVVPSAATLVQLEPGPVATPFEHRHISAEIVLCQRYYIASQFSIQGNAIAGGYVGNWIQFPTAMRATPTAVISTVAKFPASLPDPVVGATESQGIRINVLNNTGANQTNVVLGSAYTADAEL